MLGINSYMAHLGKCVELARRQGHRVIGLVYDQALSGGFITSGLIADACYALPDATIRVMGLPGMARITKVPEERLTELARSNPVFAPDRKTICAWAAWPGSGMATWPSRRCAAAVPTPVRPRVWNAAAQVGAARHRGGGQRYALERMCVRPRICSRHHLLWLNAPARLLTADDAPARHLQHWQRMRWPVVVRRRDVDAVPMRSASASPAARCAGQQAAHRLAGEADEVAASCPFLLRDIVRRVCRPARRLAGGAGRVAATYGARRHRLSVFGSLAWQAVTAEPICAAVPTSTCCSAAQPAQLEAGRAPAGLAGDVPAAGWRDRLSRWRRGVVEGMATRCRAGQGEKARCWSSGPPAWRWSRSAAARQLPQEHSHAPPDAASRHPGPAAASSAEAPR
jgi:hypothetical protein